MTAREAVEKNVSRAERLAEDIFRHAPRIAPENDAYRADLAGLLNTIYVSAIESSVKDILEQFADSHSPVFAHFVSRIYEKLNIKIGRDDLEKYAKQFGDSYGTKFKELVDQIHNELLHKRNQEERRDIKASYSNLLAWRHSFVHAGESKATLDEVKSAFEDSKKILLAFNEALLAREFATSSIDAQDTDKH